MVLVVGVVGPAFDTSEGRAASRRGMVAVGGFEAVRGLETPSTRF